MAPERTPSGFGGRLRDARERRGVSLRQIASATKISVAVLDALERNDISKLPGGIFGRAFIRSYAVEVGLDPEAMIQAFVAEFPNDTAITGRPTADRIEADANRGSGRLRPLAIVWLLALAVAIVAAIVYLATSRRSAPGDLATPVALSRAVTDSPVASAASSTPPPDAQSAPAVNAASSSRAAADTVGAATSARSALPPPAPTATSGDQLTVTLTTTRPCWVSATVDGQRSIERLLQPGEQRVVVVRRDMVLTAGDAAAIGVRFNGTQGRPLGKSGEVVTARFNLTNYKDYLQAR